MAGKDLNQKLNELISSLQDQGILDDYFDELKGLQDEQSPQFVTNTITIYLGGADDTIAELTKNLSEPAVNYPRVTYLADKLKGSSMSIGGARMADVCAELCEASEANKREACLALFGGVNREYSILQESLNKIAQLEQAIHDNKD
ncbi:putative signal transduction histidine kinase, phosphotransfer (Hpt) domain-containing protein [Rosa chinensis]|uniref:Histidine-containing phosphotransfer protein n=1 Tax=Rosa chinensis TaxID=74649 RepID=A0A2P6QHV5_ROSCH|nr:putative signal transduction histidine kinase, phosphotransfer (Hpt) domain-containing protein [Rosa chinensis]